MTILVAFLVGLLVQYLISRVYGSQGLLKKTEEQRVQLDYQNKTLHENIGSLEALLHSKHNELDEEKRKSIYLEDLYNKEIENNRKILSQKKSSEIRTGFIAESLAPFMMETHDSKNMRFLGQPIDYISFDDNGIYFIEVKSGKSDLSFNQKRIKKLIEDKKVYFEQFRISGNKQIRKVK